jgi:predicted ferric reductase
MPSQMNFRTMAKNNQVAYAQVTKYNKKRVVCKLLHVSQRAALFARSPRISSQHSCITRTTAAFRWTSLKSFLFFWCHFVVFEALTTQTLTERILSVTRRNMFSKKKRQTNQLHAVLVDKITIDLQWSDLEFVDERKSFQEEFLNTGIQFWKYKNEVQE